MTWLWSMTPTVKAAAGQARGEPSGQLPGRRPS